MNWLKIEENTPEEQFRYIIAQPGYVIGECYYGTASFYIVDPERNAKTQYQKKCWRYVHSDMPISEYLKPTHFMEIPDAP